MRVGIDAYLLHSGPDFRAAGVSTYISRVLEALPRVAPQHEYLAFCSRDSPIPSGVEGVRSPVPISNALLRIGWELSLLPIQARAKGIDLLHGTANVVPLLGSPRSIVTIHDLSFLRHPEYMPARRALYLRFAAKRSVMRASMVIAVSEFTRREILELLPVPPDRVRVVPSGLEDQFRPRPATEVEKFRQQHMGNRPYILHLGTLEPRKNIGMLIRAYAVLRKRDGIPHALALVGARGWMYEDLFRLVADLGLENDVKFIDFAPPSELPLWYNAADLFAYPSTYEGFGLPVLEAMGCGVPTITSASTAMHEVGDDACLAVELGSQEALEDGLSRLLHDSELRARLREAGPRRAATFSWEKTAAETARVYDRVLGGLSS